MRSDTVHEHTQVFSSHRVGDERRATLIHFRLIGPDDEQHLRDFFHSHTPETIHARYGMTMREMWHERALELVKLDNHRNLALIGLDGPSQQERIVAVGRYFGEEATNLAEVAFVVHEECRCMGIAKHLLQSLLPIVRGEGFAGITAQVLVGNTAMLQVLAEVLGQADQTTSGEGEMTQVFRFKDVRTKPATTRLS